MRTATRRKPSGSDQAEPTSATSDELRRQPELIIRRAAQHRHVQHHLADVAPALQKAEGLFARSPHVEACERKSVHDVARDLVGEHLQLPLHPPRLADEIVIDCEHAHLHARCTSVRRSLTRPNAPLSNLHEARCLVKQRKRHGRQISRQTVEDGVQAVPSQHVGAARKAAARARRMHQLLAKAPHDAML